jgi:DNA polymerase/3'-5' exonuclease PolX
MSSGDRIPLHVAARAADFILGCWGVPNADSVVVGSVRRRRDDVGDIEICLPHEPRERDQLYKTIHAAVGRSDALFEAPSDVPPVEVIKGLKPGFKAASVRVRVVYEGEPLTLPVEIYRYEPGARGWSILMRTGPAEFGRWYLGKWKQHWGIQANQKASIDGFLVDGYAQRVPIETEEECFSRCGLAYVEPHLRDAFAANLRGDIR